MGPLTETMKARDDRATGRHQVRHRVDDARRVSRASREARRLARTSRRSSAPRRSAIHEIGYADRAADAGRAASGCRRSCARRWRRARWASARRSSTRRRSTPRPTSWSRSPRRVAPYGGMYISHMRSEGNRLLEAIDELMTICARSRNPRRDLSPEGGGPGELGEARTRRSRRSRRRGRAGLAITADMYTYTAGATGLDARCRRGCRRAATRSGRSACRIRRSARASRRRCARRPTSGRTSSLAAGSPDKMLLVGFKNEALKQLHRQDAGRGGADARQVA